MTIRAAARCLSTILVAVLGGLAPTARGAEVGPRISAADDKPITLIGAADGSQREDAANPFGLGVYLMDGLGGPSVRICRSPTTATGSPDLSRDGKRVAFDGWQDDQGESFDASRIYTLEIDEPTKITELGSGCMPSWGPGGVGLAYSSYRPRGVAIMDAGSGGRTDLDRQGWSAEWSPDGAKIAYTAYANGAANIVVHNVLTGEDAPLLEGRVYGFFKWGFAWSPDSQRLCVLANDAQGDNVLVVVDVEGEGHEHRIISQGRPDLIRRSFDAPIAWGGDGSKVMFFANNPDRGLGSLYTLDASGESPPEEVPGLPEDTHCYAPYWSPKGAIVFIGAPVGGANAE